MSWKQKGAVLNFIFTSKEWEISAALHQAKEADLVAVRAQPQTGGTSAGSQLCCRHPGYAAAQAQAAGREQPCTKNTYLLPVTMEPGCKRSPWYTKVKDTCSDKEWWWSWSVLRGSGCLWEIIWCSFSADWLKAQKHLVVAWVAPGVLPLTAFYQQPPTLPRNGSL